jgi:hypothetical protein
MKKALLEGYDQAQLSKTLSHPKLIFLGRPLSAADVHPHS